MRQHLRIALGVIAAIVVCGTTAGSALAGAPEIGRCKNQAGNYKDNVCTEFKSPGAFAWVPGLASPGFETEGGVTTLAAPGITIQCSEVHSSGTWAVKTNDEFLELKGCMDGTKECTGTEYGPAPGEILAELEGFLAWESRTNFNVALDLHAGPNNPHGTWAELECGPAEQAGSVRVQVRGAVLGKVHSAFRGFENVEEYVVSAGKQVPESYVTSGWFGYTKKATLELAVGAAGDCIHFPGAGSFRWTNAACTALSEAPNRGDYCRVPEAGCETDAATEPATLAIENMHERRSEIAEINNKAGASGHAVIFKNEAGPALKANEHVQFTIRSSVSGGEVTASCGGSGAQGLIVANEVKKGVLSIGSVSFEGEKEARCESGGVGPVVVSASGLPWTAELTTKGTVKVKGSKKIVLNATFPGLPEEPKCTWEASKLAGTYQTLLPLDLSFSNQPLKRSKSSSASCPSVVQMSAESNVTDEGSQLEAEL